jgi:hypothetical protein
MHKSELVEGSEKISGNCNVGTALKMTKGVFKEDGRL